MAAKQKWSPEEDLILVEHVAAFLQSHNSQCSDDIPAILWREAAEKLSASRRTVKQCRERWRNQIDPRLSELPWTEEEDQQLEDLRKVHGNSWRLLADLMPGRSENAIKNRHYSAKRRAQRQNRKPGHSGSASSRAEREGSADDGGEGAEEGDDDGEAAAGATGGSARKRNSGFAPAGRPDRPRRHTAAPHWSDDHDADAEGDPAPSASSSSGVAEGLTLRPYEGSAYEAASSEGLFSMSARGAGGPGEMYNDELLGQDEGGEGEMALASSRTHGAATDRPMSARGSEAGAPARRGGPARRGRRGGAARGGGIRGARGGARTSRGSRGTETTPSPSVAVSPLEGSEPIKFPFAAPRMGAAASPTATNEEGRSATSLLAPGAGGASAYAGPAFRGGGGGGSDALAGLLSAKRARQLVDGAATSRSSGSGGWARELGGGAAAPLHRGAGSSSGGGGVPLGARRKAPTSQTESDAASALSAIADAAAVSSSAAVGYGAGGQELSHGGSDGGPNSLMSAECRELMQQRRGLVGERVAGGRAPQAQLANPWLQGMPPASDPLSAGFAMLSAPPARLLTSQQLLPLAGISLPTPLPMHRRQPGPSGHVLHAAGGSAAAQAFSFAGSSSPNGGSAGFPLPTAGRSLQHTPLLNFTPNPAPTSASAPKPVEEARAGVAEGAYHRQRGDYYGGSGSASAAVSPHLVVSASTSYASSEEAVPGGAVAAAAAAAPAAPSAAATHVPLTLAAAASPPAPSLGGAGSGGSSSPLGGAAADAALLATYEAALTQAQACAQAFFAASASDPSAASAYELQWSVIAQHVNTLAGIISQRQIVSFVREADGTVNALPGLAYPYSIRGPVPPGQRSALNVAIPAVPAPAAVAPPSPALPAAAPAKDAAGAPAPGSSLAGPASGAAAVPLRVTTDGQQQAPAAAPSNLFSTGGHHNSSDHRLVVASMAVLPPPPPFQQPARSALLKSFLGPSEARASLDCDLEGAKHFGRAGGMPPGEATSDAALAAIGSVGAAAALRSGVVAGAPSSACPPKGGSAGTSAPSSASTAVAAAAASHAALVASGAAAPTHSGTSPCPSGVQGTQRDATSAQQSGGGPSGYYFTADDSMSDDTAGAEATAHHTARGDGSDGAPRREYDGKGTTSPGSASSNAESCGQSGSKRSGVGGPIRVYSVPPGARRQMDRVAPHPMVSRPLASPSSLTSDAFAVVAAGAGAHQHRRLMDSPCIDPGAKVPHLPASVSRLFTQAPSSDGAMTVFGSTPASGSPDGATLFSNLLLHTGRAPIDDPLVMHLGSAPLSASSSML